MTENDYIIKHADFYGDDAADTVDAVCQIARMLGETSGRLPDYVDFIIYSGSSIRNEPYNVQVYVKRASMTPEQMEIVAAAPVSIHYGSLTTIS